MTRARIAGGAFTTALVLLAVAAGYRALNQDAHPAAATSPAITPSTSPAAAEAHAAAETHIGERNAGMLIFVDGRERPEYVSWTDVEQIDFDRPPATYPPLGSSAGWRR